MQAGFRRLVVMSGKEAGSCREGRDGRRARTCGIISPVFSLSSSARRSGGLQAGVWAPWCRPPRLCHPPGCCGGTAVCEAVFTGRLQTHILIFLGALSA